VGLSFLDLRGRKWQEAGEDCMTKNFVTCMLNHILGGKGKEVEMDGSCRMHGRGEKCV
jgi:hypothetical protein